LLITPPPFVVTRRHLYQATFAQGRVRKIERLRSNPSRGANFKFLATLVATKLSLHQIRTADGKQDGSTTTRSGGDRPQGDRKGEGATGP
jgi:hypothetical protein